MLQLPRRGRMHCGRDGLGFCCWRCLQLLLLRDCFRFVGFWGLVTENLQISRGLRCSLLRWVSDLPNCPRAWPRARRCSALASSVPDCRTCVVFSGVVAIADLRGRHKEVALVGALCAASCRVPAVVLHVKERAEPLPVPALCAFDAPAVVGAHPKFQSHVCPASSFSAFASALSFALTFFPFTFPASFRGACVWLPSGVWIPSLSALVALV